MANDDGEFRGSTKQAIQDLTSRFDRFETHVIDQIGDLGTRWEGKLDSVVKLIGDKEDRYAQKFASATYIAAMDDEIKDNKLRIDELRREVDTLKGWQRWVVGILTTLLAVVTFFGESIRNVIFNR